MSLVSLEEAKLHLRVDASDEDVLIQGKINTAEIATASYLNRYIYTDSSALSAAIEAAPTALSAASTAYQSAVALANALPNEIERDIALEAAEFAYSAAQTMAKMTYVGMVTNDVIRDAVLLHVGTLYENREAIGGDKQVSFSEWVLALLNPYRARMGV